MNDKTKAALINAETILSGLRLMYIDLAKSKNAKSYKQQIEESGKCIKELSLLLAEQCKQTEKYFELYTKSIAKDVIE